MPTRVCHCTSESVEQQSLRAAVEAEARVHRVRRSQRIAGVEKTEYVRRRTRDRKAQVVHFVGRRVHYRVASHVKARGREGAVEATTDRSRHRVIHARAIRARHLIATVAIAEVVGGSEFAAPFGNKAVARIGRASETAAGKERFSNSVIHDS